HALRGDRGIPAAVNDDVRSLGQLPKALKRPMAGRANHASARLTGLDDLDADAAVAKNLRGHEADRARADDCDVARRVLEGHADGVRRGGPAVDEAGDLE